MTILCETPEAALRPETNLHPATRDRTDDHNAPSAWRTHQITRRDILLAAALAGLTLLARAPFILHGEMLLHSDEAIVGVMAQDIAEGRRLPIYFYGQRYMGALEAYAIAALRPLIADPMISLRLGPALFLVALVATQYFLLTRWFGRRGGIVGALTLIAAAPMFAQWSIAARGGYIEVFWAGTLLWWAYSEWFVGRDKPTARQQVCFGLLIGVGLWLNQMMLAFLAPVIVHALLARWRFSLRTTRSPHRWLPRLFRTPVALPLVAIAPLVFLSFLCSVQITPHGVQYSLLGGAVPRNVAGVLIGALAGVAAFGFLRSPAVMNRLRTRLVAAAPLILGITVGQLPVALYIASRTLAGKPLEASIPLAIRPIWSIGEPFIFAARGVPLLFGADPSPSLELVLVGHDYQLPAVSLGVARTFALLNVFVWLALAVLAGILVRRHFQSFRAALRLRPGVYSPPVFLSLASGAAIAAYLLSGASFHFNTIRYLLPLWIVLPGLLAAAVYSTPHRRITWFAVATLLACWSAGQWQMWKLTRAPHPLSAVAQDLRGRHVRFAVAEMFDAHLLSFLTQQEIQVAEFRPCWSRLPHYRDASAEPREVSYVVKIAPSATGRPWRFPGPPPLENSAVLAPALQHWARQNPDEVISQSPLSGGYELWTLAHPLPEN